MHKPEAGAPLTRRAVAKLGLLGATGLAGCATLPSPGLLPAQARVEWRTDPVGMDSLQPRFRWTLRPAGAGASDLLQRGFRLILRDHRGGIVFDSGWVASAMPAFTPAKPLPLASQAAYRWSLAVEDGSGRRSEEEVVGRFVTGVLSPQGWSARWIAARPQAGKPGRAVEWHWPMKAEAEPLPLLRTRFDEPRSVVSAFLSVAGLGQYKLAVNGEWLNPGDLLSTWSDYDKTVYYDSFDVTALVRPGATALSVMLGNGFFNVEGITGRYTKFVGSFGVPRLLLQLRLVFADGSDRLIVSDDGWAAADGPVRYSSIFGGEDFDARLDRDGWLAAASAPTGFRAAVIVAAPLGALRANLIGMVGTVHSYASPEIRPLPGGALMADFGHNFSGRPVLTLTGAKPGQAVTMKPGELLLADGSIDQGSATGGKPGYCGIAFGYVAHGRGGAERWSPAFTYTGFRYLQIEGAERSQLSDLSAAFTSLKTPQVGHFRCSDAGLEAIHALIVQALRSNLASVATDCPHREKLGWTEQLYLNSDTAMYNRDVAALYEKVARDMRDAQTPEGMVPSIAPEFVRFVGRNGQSTAFRDSPEWSCAIVLASWHAYCTYGDLRILQDNFAAMQRHLAYLASRAQDGVLDFGLGDWFDIGPAKPGPAQLTSRAFTATATFCGSLAAAAQIAERLGRREDAERYAADAQRTAATINQRFLQPGTGVYDRNSQAANAMALVFDIVPAALKARTLAALIADVEVRQHHVSAGDVGFHYVVRALSDARRADVLLRMMGRRDAPSYLAQIARGATALTEAWDAAPHASQNHFMLGHIERWLYDGLGGIRMQFHRPAAPPILIAPQMPAGLDWVEVAYDSVLGAVRVAWRKDGEQRWRVDVEIPPGANAELRLPDRGVQVIGSGKRRFEVRGL